MRRAVRVSNVHVMLATAAGLVLLVSLTLGWLGWRLVTQEAALQERRAHDRLEGRADELLAGLLRRVEEKKAWLSQMGSTLPPDGVASGQPGAGAILVAFSKSGVQVQPPGHLLYYPVVPAPPHLDESLFQQATELEFRAANLVGAADVLTALTRSTPAPVRAEALLRLAAVEAKRGRTTDAMATYAKLTDDATMSQLEVPYGLLSRFARCQLQKDSHQEDAARKEATALLASLESGKWTLGKGSYAYYSSSLRKLLGLGPPRSVDGRIAVATAVERAWSEWRLFQTSGTQSMTRPFRVSGDVEALAIVNANPERMVSLIYAGDALRHLGFDHSAARDTGDVQAWLTDERGRLVAGTQQSGMHSTRSLSAIELPWELHVADAPGSVTSITTERRSSFIFALAAIVGLVLLACYAMARGVLREAAAGQLQSDFVSAVSHEFRSPLTTLRQLTELLADGRIQDEGRRFRYFRVLQQETSRLHQLVENLLDFGRIDAGRLRYQLEPVDFSQLVRDGVADYQTHAGENGHAIEISAERDGLLVDADREAMRRVIRNLLENAVKYSPAATTVWVDTGCEERAAVLRVRDEGIGIPPDEHARIFDKFVRGEAAKQQCIPGTGVGLAMVKEILRVHRGDVNFVSEVGRGSTFTVRLPLSGALHEGLQ
jgi:signal transduction histidine kinase